MQAIRRFVQAQFFVLLMLMLAGGFAMLLAELLWTEHTDGIQLVGAIASVVGLVLTLAALVVRGRAAMTLAVLLLLLSVTGLIGTFEHLEEGGEARGEAQRVGVAVNQQIAFTDDDDDRAAATQEGGEREGEEGEAVPPPLAPLSLAGLSIFGVLAILGAPRKEV